MSEQSRSRRASGGGRRYRFVGDPHGRFLNGIPARDLSAEDVDALTDEQKAAVRASDLYRSAERDGSERDEEKE